MADIEKIDHELFIAKYGESGIGDANALWAQIKSNPEILREAVKIKRNKWNNGDLVHGLTISGAMLMDYEDVDPVAYSDLIKSIYTNTDIARHNTKPFNSGYSFLLMSLWNHSLKLAEEQKAFAVDEAMNSDSQVHGTSALDIRFESSTFDIRYCILRNPNWTLEEKQKLIMAFWDDAETYDEYLEQWEWAIVNDNENYKGNSLPPFDRYELLNEWTYEMLLEYYGNKETTDRIWSEIEFCKLMHELRPQQWEIKIPPQEVFIIQPIEPNKG